MTHYKTDKYRIDIYDKQALTEGLDNTADVYDFVYFEESKYRFHLFME